MGESFDLLAVGLVGGTIAFAVGRMRAGRALGRMSARHARGEPRSLLLLIMVRLPANRDLAACRRLPSRGISPTSPILDWVRLVATALLAGVVAKLLVSPNGALAAAPIWGRFGGVAAGFAGFFVFRRSLIAGVLCGEAVLVAAAWWVMG